MMITYEITCPTCGQQCTKRRRHTQAPPLYCSPQCNVGRINARRRDDPSQIWRKYYFDDLMNQAIIRAKRGGLGALKRLWRTDPRFERAGIPYPIMKRQAVLLGALRTVHQ